MYNNITFIGGIHGVGKTTICKKICDKVKLEYLSASDLLKWKDINEDSQNKKVKDIPATQGRLIFGLTKTIQENKSYILDGHYCLLNSENKIINIPLDAFRQIKPISLNIILGDIIEIKDRLEIRDNKPYDQDLLNRMQQSELKYAKYLSTKLKVPLSTGTQKDFSEILDSLHKIFFNQ